MNPTSEYHNNALAAAMNLPWVIAHRAQRDNHPQTSCRSISTRLVGSHEQHYVMDVVFEYWIDNASVDNDDIWVRVLVHHQTGVAQAVQWHLTHL